MFKSSGFLFRYEGDRWRQNTARVVVNWKQITHDRQKICVTTKEFLVVFKSSKRRVGFWNASQATRLTSISGSSWLNQIFSRKVVLSHSLGKCFISRETKCLVCTNELAKAKKKSKAVPLHAMEALGGRGGIAPTHSRPRHYMGVSGQRHAPAVLCPGERSPQYPLYRRLGGPHSYSGC
jgi:hypothetical protein